MSLTPNPDHPPCTEETNSTEYMTQGSEMRLEAAMQVKARAVIDQPEKVLEYDNTQTAPIYCIPFDLLSIIFIEVTRVEWKAVFTLGIVCRSWRQSILETRQAWSMVKLEKIGTGLPVLTVVGRAAPYSVKIIATSPGNFHLAPLIVAFTERIRHLAIDIDVFKTPTEPFLNLTTLVIRDLKQTHTVDPRVVLDGDKFPKLRSLSTGDLLDSGDVQLSPNNILPPIEEFTLLTRRPHIIAPILERLAHRLTLLHICFPRPDRISAKEPMEVIFPRLRSLSIVTTLTVLYSGSTNMWPFTARTPVLTTYNEGPIFLGVTNFHRDTKTVTQLGFWDRIDFSLLPSVREVTSKSSGIVKLLNALREDPQAMPDLEMVRCKREDDIGEKLDSFNRTYGRNIGSNLTEAHVPYLRPPHYDWNLEIG